MRRVDSHKLGANCIEVKAEPVQPLAQDFIGGAGFGIRIRPGVHQRANRFEASRVTDGNFVKRRGGLAPDTGKAHAVRAGLFQLDGGKVRDTIGGDIRMRIAQLIQKLLGDGIHRDTATSSGVLGDHERAVRLGFNDRVADVCVVGDGLPIYLAIAAGALRAALHGVSGDGAGR